MKIIKILKVNNEEVGLISEDLRLELSSPGRATFVVRANQPLSQIVTFDAGWSDGQVWRVFVGYIESSITINQQQQKLFCRELTATLNRDLFLALRRVTLKDVTNRLNELTNLNFALPDADYCRQQSPFYYHLGDGYQAMDNLGRVYQIPFFIWQMQGNGTVYVGSWVHSRWASRPIELPDKLFTRHLSFTSARLPMTPGIRPGVKFNRGLIHSVQLTDDFMDIAWKPFNELSTASIRN